MKASYLETIGLVERLHRHFLEIVRLDEDIIRLEATWQGALEQARQMEAQVERLGQRLQEADQEVRRRDVERSGRQETFTQAKVGLGKIEERAASLRAQHEQRARDLDQLSDDILAVVNKTLQPASATLWVRPKRGGKL